MSWDPIERNSTRYYEPEVWDDLDENTEFGYGRDEEIKSARIEIRHQIEKYGTPVHSQLNTILGRMVDTSRIPDHVLYNEWFYEHQEDLKRRIEYDKLGKTAQEIKENHARTVMAEKTAKRIIKKRDENWRLNYREAKRLQKLREAADIIYRNMEEIKHSTTLELPPYYLYDNNDPITSDDIALVIPVLQILINAAMSLVIYNQDPKNVLFYSYILSKEMNAVRDRFMVFIKKLIKIMNIKDNDYSVRVVLNRCKDYFITLVGNSSGDYKHDYILDYVVKSFVVAYKTNDFSYITMRYGITKRDIEWLNCYFGITARDEQRVIPSDYVNFNIYLYYDHTGYDSNGKFMELFNRRNIDKIINHFAEKIPVSYYKMIRCYNKYYVAECNNITMYGAILRMYQIIFDQILVHNAKLKSRQMNDIYDIMIDAYCDAYNHKNHYVSGIKVSRETINQISVAERLPSARILKGFIYYYEQLEAMKKSAE